MKRIPVLLTKDEANALIDTWEALQHDVPLTYERYHQALDTIEWLRSSIGNVGKPPKNTLTERIRLEWRVLVVNVKHTWLRWRYRQHAHVLRLTQRERTALLSLLILQKPNMDLMPVIERLKGGEREE